MGVTPNQKPDGGDLSAGDNASVSGFAASGDPTNEPGQYPPGNWGTALFGGPLPTHSAPGSPGAPEGADDPTTEPGQTSDGLTGTPDSFITQTGAPGMATTPNTDGGSTSINFTRPGSYLSGTYKTDSYSDDLSGVRDSTQANDTGYGTGGPQLPGIAGNEPVSGGKYQPGSGRVLRGGRSVRP